ncbi:glycosyl hydrolase family 18 protein [Dictyobacter aurantiacus]|uniref:GH18 domain-containing protein n=1 Tax=Dictyobacter aurantiacus TaxID=1936993 RepID=A0A401ZG78_9CHLR|nr:glycosyl hydrolase family 18 protein [Dictyobacter aurantiacus]GCE05849.1 hypothetical protein KDAU_31780 [Dictyobacter aurantiacus]
MKKLIFVTLCILIIAIPTVVIVLHYAQAQNSPQHAASLPSKPTQPANAWKAHVMAWIYPGPPACNAANEYKDGRIIDTLKPQYYTLNQSGVLIQLDAADKGCNAYSQENAADIKQHSAHQYVTVAGDATSMGALVTDQDKMLRAVNTLKTFVDTVKFTGVEIDFEEFSQWTPQQYHGYKSFLTQLGEALHQGGFKLMVDGPPMIADDTSQYQWRYEDFNTLPIDYIVVMEYDWQYDFGVGTPIAPLAREEDTTRGIIAKISDINKIVVGIPAYGYHGQKGSTKITIDTNAQSQMYPGYATAKRDNSSAEMMFTNAGVFYDYADTQTLNTRRSLIESLGIRNISVWHLGGNQWFSGKSEPRS